MRSTTTRKEERGARVLARAALCLPLRRGGEGRVSYRERWLDSGSSGGGSTGSGSLGDQQSRALGVGLSDPAALRLFGWGLDYSRSETRYDERATRDVEQEVARGTLFINLDPQFRLRAIGGYE